MSLGCSGEALGVFIATCQQKTASLEVYGLRCFDHFCRL